MNIIIANFGNDSIALIQWAHEHHLDNVTVIYVETGWAAPEWGKRVEHCQSWLKKLGMNSVTLKPRLSFTDLMQERGQFPTRKFQWCASILKGAVIVNW